MTDPRDTTAEPWQTCGILSCDMEAQCKQPDNCKSTGKSPTTAPQLSRQDLDIVARNAWLCGWDAACATITLPIDPQTRD